MSFSAAPGGLAPILSIICPVFKIGHRFAPFWQHLTKILATDQRLEIIIVNDGSSDDTQSLLEQHNSGLPQVRVLFQPNGGLSSARNAGIAKARGSYILFLDDDDELILSNLPDLIDEAVASDADMLALPYIERAKADQSIRPHTELGTKLTGAAYFHHSLLTKSHFITPSWAYCYRTIFLSEEKLLFQPGLIHEDCLFTTQAMVAAKHFQLFDRPIYLYIKRVNSITTSSNSQKNRKRVKDLGIIIGKLGQLAQESPSNMTPSLARWQAFLLNYQLDVLQQADSAGTRWSTLCTGISFARNNIVELMESAPHHQWYRRLICEAVIGRRPSAKPS
jgi:glycosyltransferase involved in cell wall biosynthesis